MKDNHLKALIVAGVFVVVLLLMLPLLLLLDGGDPGENRDPSNDSTRVQGAAAVGEPERPEDPEPPVPEPISAKPSELVANEADGDGEIDDLFGWLRQPQTKPDVLYWQQVGDALRGLKTIEGASYSHEFGTLTIHGEAMPDGEQGPFHLDDLMLALQANFFGTEPLAVSIDPQPATPGKAKRPMQSVRYLGGCEDTALGWLLFECDRILKGLSQGEDNLTNKPMRPRIAGFYNMLELGEHFKEPAQQNRFWISFGLEDPTPGATPKRSNGSEPVVQVTAGPGSGKHSSVGMSISHCQLYVRSEIMKGDKGLGKMSKAAEQFSRHFNHYYDQFAKIYPEFERLKAIAPLMVLADWIQSTEVPLDLDLIRDYQQQVMIKTPTETPENTVTKEWLIPGGKKMLTSIGGVNFKPRSFHAEDAQGKAADTLKLARSELRNNKVPVSWRAESPDGLPPQMVVVIPTSRTGLSSQPQRTARTKKFDPNKPGDVGVPAPAPAVVPKAARTEKVRAEKISLANIDRLRAKPARGPPDSPAEVLVDQRHLPAGERMTTVAVERTRLVGMHAPGGERIRGPPAERTASAVGERNLKPTSERMEPMAVERVPLTDRMRPNNSRAPPVTSTRPGPVAERTERIPREPTRLNPNAASSRSEMRDTPGLPVFEDAGGRLTYNFPRFRAFSDPLRKTWLEGSGGSKLEIPRQQTIQSPLGDVFTEFGEHHSDRLGLYTTPFVTGGTFVQKFYPQRHELKYGAGGSIVFNVEGYPEKVVTPKGDQFTFQYGAEVGGHREPTTCEFVPAERSAMTIPYDLRLAVPE